MISSMHMPLATAKVFSVSSANKGDNMKLDIDADKPTWENFKTILKGASIYE